MCAAAIVLCMVAAQHCVTVLPMSEQMTQVCMHVQLHAYIAYTITIYACKQLCCHATDAALRLASCSFQLDHESSTVVSKCKGMHICW